MNILESCLYTEKLDEERKFYEGILEFDCFVFQPPTQAFFRLDDTVLLIFNPDETEHSDKLPPHGADGCIHVCFALEKDRLDDWSSRLEEHGYEITWAEWPNGRSFYTYDPAGHLVEFAPPAIWGFEA